jgi:hypothetical protein
MKQSGNNTRDRERCPDIKADIGEDPAKFLDQPLTEYGEDHTDNTGRRMFIERVSGIDSLTVLRVWKGVERNRLERGPREAVIQVLEQRESYLERVGEREERIAGQVPYRPRVAPRTAEDYQQMIDEAGPFQSTAGLERLRDKKRAESVPEDDDQEQSPTSTASSEALVADGGESA